MENPRFGRNIFGAKLTALANGVLTPGVPEEEVGRFIHSQFSSETGAKDYASRYAQSNYFAGKLKAALERLDRPPPPRALVLDVGSGSGNTVFPMLQLLPKARIVATDLSVPLLGLLLERPTSGRVVAIQENAEALRFKPGTFDLVVGGAILHHLFHPERALVRAAEVLRPGAAAVFFEPCENGQLLVRLAYERILLDPRAAELDDRVKGAIERQIHYIGTRVRVRANENPEHYADKEDKWLFPRSYFERAGRAAGFSRVSVEPLDPNPIRGKIVSHFRLLSLAPPDWVFKIAADMESSFSQEFLAQNPAGVSVVLQKRAAPAPRAAPLRLRPRARGKARRP